MHLELYAWSPPGSRAVPIYKRGGHVRAFAWVDEEDYELAGSRRYNLSQSGYAKRYQYPGGHKQGMFLHRDVMGFEFGDERRVDHINRRRLDCRKANLRCATHAENLQNRSLTRNSSSRYRGVSWDPRLKVWVAQVAVGRRQYYLGTWKDESDARAVAAEFRRLYVPFAVD